MAERFETQSTKLSSANSVTDVYALANTDSSDDRSVVLSVMAANTDGTNSVDVSLFVTATSSSSTTVATVEGESTSFYLAKTITIPADASLVVLSKETSMYLEEGASLRALADSAFVDVICSYEEIS